MSVDRGVEAIEAFCPSLIHSHEDKAWATHEACGGENTGGGVRALRKNGDADQLKTKLRQWRRGRVTDERANS